MEKIPQPEALDVLWYKRYEALNFEDYEKLSGEADAREEQKALFLGGENRNPGLDYPELETFNIDEREQALLTLKKDILSLEKNEAVKKIYRTKINELRATLKMLRATKEGNDNRFSTYAEFIYGMPEQSDTNYVVRHVQHIIAQHVDSHDNAKQQAAARLVEIFGNMTTEDDNGASASILPQGEKIDGKVQDVDEAVAAFTEALAELGAADWTVEVDTDKGISNFSVSQEHKVVRIPSEEKIQSRALSRKKMKALIAHEISTHVARRHNGERSKLQLLGLGLDRYLRGEEGIATYNEQQIMGAKEFAGIPRFLSVAVAKGIDGTPRDFRDTFNVMKDYRLLTSPKKDITEESAAEIAYTDCLRIFRGTTGTTPGAIYPKDMAYFGNRAIWTLVSKDSDVVQHFCVGKYDPTNNEHVALLSQLGILDQDLERLDSVS